MNDDWRLRIDLREPGLAKRLGEMLEKGELEHDLESTFHDRVIVSVDGSELFCYAGTREQAQAARELVLRVAAAHGWQPELELTHWHPVAERWEDPDAPLPDGRVEDQVEHEQRVADERAGSMAEGYPEFEVRVQCGSRHEARELSQQLGGEGVPNIHRWSYVLIGATDEDSANSLAERVRAEVAASDAVTVELNRRFVWDNRPWSPFAVMGGLGG